MIIFFNLLLQITFIILFFFSICGFGKLVATKTLGRSNNQNSFLVFFLGLTVVYLIQFFLYFFFSINYFTNSFLLIIGLLIFYKNFKFYKIDLKIFLFLSLALFTVFIISKTHEDFKHHHLQAVIDIFDNRLTLGKSNLNPAFIYIPSISYVISFTVLPIIDFKFFHIIPFLIYVSFLGYLLSAIVKKSKYKINFLILLIIIFYLFQFKYLKKFGFDLSAFIFCTIFFLESLKDNKFLNNIIFFIFACSIKITSIFIMPLVIYFFVSYLKIKEKIIKFPLVFGNVLILVVLISNFINNGCIIYTFKETCFGKNSVSWAIDKNQIEAISIQTELDTKSFYQQNQFESDEYLRNFNWIKSWARNNFYYKIFNFIALFFVSIFLISITQKTSIRYDKKYFYLWVCSLICFLMWILKIPTLRYGLSPLFLFLISSTIFFFGFNKIQIKSNKKILALFLCSIILVNFLNFKRIYSEFGRKDSGYFSTFPHYYLPQRKYDTFIIDKKKFNISSDSLIYPCWNIPNQCVEYKNFVLKKKTFYYIISRH